MGRSKSGAKLTKRGGDGIASTSSDSSHSIYRFRTWGPSIGKQAGRLISASRRDGRATHHILYEVIAKSLYDGVLLEYIYSNLVYMFYCIITFCFVIKIDTQVHFLTNEHIISQ